MNAQELASFYENELLTLIKELESYGQEENIWKTDRNVSNSAGNLSLHLVGNLHTFIGKVLGKTDYIRERELEFSQKNVTRTTLIKNIQDTMQMIQTVLLSMPEEDLKKAYPEMKFSEVQTTEYLLVHLLKHLTYHLGQINYHRRLLDI